MITSPNTREEVEKPRGVRTTVVEAIVNNRIGIGADINNIAYLLAKVKTTPIKTAELLQEFSKIEFDLQNRLNGQ